MKRSIGSWAKGALALSALGLGAGTLQSCAVEDEAVRSSSSSGEARQQVQQKLTVDQAVSVTVVLKKGLSPEELRAAQDDIEAKLAGPGSRATHKFTLVAGMGVVIGSQADFDMLASHPLVESFSLDTPLEPLMNETRGIVGADELFTAGFDGSSRTVAVVDSGIDITHADLTDNIADEACFCATSNCCPNGTFHQFGAGAAEDADGHGTHVSGIITGAGNVAPRGVAPGTHIVAVIVDSTNDTLAALQWVAIAHPEVDAINLSRGTFPSYSKGCETAWPGWDLMEDMIAAVRALDIPVIVSSGNGGSPIGMSFPACVTSAISVGATNKNDTVATFSNSVAQLDLLAPGAGFAEPTMAGDIEDECPSDAQYCVAATGLPNRTARLQGTSMAAPHVTAAFALLKQADPDLTAEEILDCLKAGPLVADTRVTPARQTPRLDLPAAFAACGIPYCNVTTYEAEAITQSAGGAAPPDGWNLHSNGYISTNHTFEAGPSQITARMLGQSAGGQAPHMTISVGGTVIGSEFVSQTTYTDFSFPFMATAGTQEIRITFDNDYYVSSSVDRNLWIDRLTVDCIDALPAGPCDGICSSPQYLSWSGGSYQSGNIGTGAICRTTYQTVTGGNCGNFAPGRQFQVNGTTRTCNGGQWSPAPTERNGGYCFSSTSGNYDWAYFTLW